jgi:hypothetical protein
VLSLVRVSCTILPSLLVASHIHFHVDTYFLPRAQSSIPYSLRALYIHLHACTSFFLRAQCTFHRPLLATHTHLHVCTCLLLHVNCTIASLPEPACHTHSHACTSLLPHAYNTIVVLVPVSHNHWNLCTWGHLHVTIPFIIPFPLFSHPSGCLHFSSNAVSHDCALDSCCCCC